MLGPAVDGLVARELHELAHEAPVVRLALERPIETRRRHLEGVGGRHGVLGIEDGGDLLRDRLEVVEADPAPGAGSYTTGAGDAFTITGWGTGYFANMDYGSAALPRDINETGDVLTFARVNHPKNEWLFTADWGVDVAVSSAVIIQQLVEHEMTLGDVVDVLRLRAEGVAVEEVVLPAASTAVVEAYITMSSASPPELTEREREVLQLVAEGKTSKEIAEKLNITWKTAESHRTHIMEKLAIHDIAGLVRYAIRHGLIQA